VLIKWKQNPVPVPQIFKKFVFIFIPSIILVLMISFISNYFYSLSKKNLLLEVQKNHITITTNNLTDEFETVFSDLSILSSMDKLVQFVGGGHNGYLKDIENIFVLFSTQKKMYDQIRLLDETGMEIVRVNYNNGKPDLVSKEKLQNKKDRYYFKNTIELEKGQVYVSPFDLNIENKKIEQPLKPMIRFSLPVFDINGDKKGILVLNYLGNRILERITRQEKGQVAQLLLINRDGYWLKGARPEIEWGFMYPDKRDEQFKKQFPDSWNKINTKSTGQFENSDGLFTYQRINPIPEYFENHGYLYTGEDWLLISWVSEILLKKQIKNFTQSLIILNLSLILLLAIISWFYSILLIRKKIAEEELLKHQRFKGVLEMAGAASHELNQPLQAASINAQLLMKEISKDDESFQRVAKLNGQLIRLGEITKKLMQITTYKTKDYADGSKIIDIDESSV